MVSISAAICEFVVAYLCRDLLLLQCCFHEHGYPRLSLISGQFVPTCFNLKEQSLMPLACWERAKCLYFMQNRVSHLVGQSNTEMGYSIKCPSNLSGRWLTIKVYLRYLRNMSKPV